MRLWVRTGVQMKRYRGFSRAVAIEPDASQHEALYQTVNPLSRQADSRVQSC
jgi:hypothetical protein